MNEPLIEDWWEGNAPREEPVPALHFGRGLSEDLYSTWWLLDNFKRISSLYA